MNRGDWIALVLLQIIAKEQKPITNLRRHQTRPYGFQCVAYGIGETLILGKRSHSADRQFGHRLLVRKVCQSRNFFLLFLYPSVDLRELGLELRALPLQIRKFFFGRLQYSGIVVNFYRGVIAPGPVQ
jgi:hypothetical protein